jgi:hypothetical protein
MALCFQPTVLAKNVINLTNVELADVRLLPFPNPARPYISTDPLPSHWVSRPSCYASRDHRDPPPLDPFCKYRMHVDLALDLSEHGDLIGWN